MRLILIALGAVLSGIGLSERDVAAEIGISDQEIRIGVVNSIDGTHSHAGIELNRGLNLKLDEINSEGGIFGRKIRVIHYNDSFEPEKTVNLTRKMIQSDRVFVLINYAGTSTVRSVVPEINASDIPFLFPRTGDDIVRIPPQKNIFTLGPSFSEQIERIIQYWVGEKKLTRITILRQTDGYGDAMGAALINSLRKRGLSPRASVKFQRDAADINAPYRELVASNPEAVLFAISSVPLSKFIKRATADGVSWAMASAENAVGVYDYLSETEGQGYLFAQPIPNPDTSDLPIARAFREANKAVKSASPQVNYPTFEGYVKAAIFAQALRLAGRDLTRDGLRGALLKVRDLDGLVIRLNSSRHQALDKVYLIRREGKRFIEF